ncbi:MAG: flagellar biosynthesis protein FlhA [Acidimicrobiales bacterium]
MTSKGIGGGLLSALVIGIVALMIIPLPGVVLDLLLAVNLALAVTLLLTTILSTRSLDMASFPSLLLVATLFRLALNVSSTRLILTTGSAGSVITSFGSFVVGGSIVVGLVVFLILVIIQFVVITNGASRVAEVGARFTLDAMPGKQMAIDADLGAGLIDEETARNRREEISQEADFYGAMDGASKFVKGDAIAGVLITVINLLGGMVIGVVEQGMGVSEAVNNFSTLTIGDGLVSQIPALLISIASGIIVTRATGGSDLGSDIAAQIGAQHKALRFGGMAIAGLALAPGLPFLPFITVGGSMLVISRRLQIAAAAQPLVQALDDEVHIDPDDPQLLAGEIRPEPLGLELAIDMVDLVDTAVGGDLLDRVRALRRKLALELGLIIPAVHTRDNMDLLPGEYAIMVHGVEMGRGRAPAGHVLVISESLDSLPGPIENEPVFGLPAKWIPEEQRFLAEGQDATIIDRSSVLTTHLAEVVRSNAPDLLSRQEVKELIDLVRQTDPAVVEELIASDLTIAELQRVLQELLSEQVPIRDIVRIIDVVSERARLTRDVRELTESVRVALGPSISAGNATANGVLPVLTIDPMLEHKLMTSLRDGVNGTDFQLEPNDVQGVIHAFRTKVAQVEQRGLAPVILTSRTLRRPLRHLLALTEVMAPVLSIEELGPQVQVETQGLVEIQPSALPPTG